jgi:putative NADH-flavin reductase
MRILLLGATGNLGLRCIPALVVQNHTLTIYVRNIPKLQSLVSPSLLSSATVVQGDATDPAGIKKALVEHEIEGIVDVAGNQVFPWHEYLLPKIAKAVCEAAAEVGRERGGKPLRVWVSGGMGELEYPGTGGKLLRDL